MQRGSRQGCSDVGAQCHADLRRAIIERRVSFSDKLADLLPKQGVRACYAFDKHGRYVSPWPLSAPMVDRHF